MFCVKIICFKLPQIFFSACYWVGPNEDATLLKFFNRLLKQPISQNDAVAAESQIPLDGLQGEGTTHPPGGDTCRVFTRKAQEAFRLQPDIIIPIRSQWRPSSSQNRTGETYPMGVTMEISLLMTRGAGRMKNNRFLGCRNMKLCVTRLFFLTQHVFACTAFAGLIRIGC